MKNKRGTNLKSSNKPDLAKLESMIAYDKQLSKSLKYTTLLICYFLIYVHDAGNKFRPIDFRRFIHETVFEEAESKVNRDRNLKLLKKIVYSAKKLSQHHIIKSEESLLGLKKETYYYFDSGEYDERDLHSLFAIISSHIPRMYIPSAEANQILYYSDKKELDGTYKYFNTLIKNADEIWIKRTFRLYDFENLHEYERFRIIQLFNNLYDLANNDDTTITLALIVKSSPPIITDSALRGILDDILKLGFDKNKKYFNISIIEDLVHLNSQMGVKNRLSFSYIERWKSFSGIASQGSYYRIFTDKNSYIESKNLLLSTIRLIKEYYPQRIKQVEFLY